MGNFGLSKKDAAAATESIKEAYPLLQGDITENSKAILSSREKALQAPPPAQVQSQMRQLAQYASLGIFDGAHDNLLAQVTGVSPDDVESIQKMKEFADQYNRINQSVGGNQFAANQPLHELQLKMDEIISKAITNRSRGLRAVSALRNTVLFQNMAMVGNYVNAMANITSHLVEQQNHRWTAWRALGSDIANNPEYSKLAKATFRDVTQGGEIGSTLGANFNTKENLLNSFSLRGSKEAIENAKTTPETIKAYAKRAVALATLFQRATLHGIDGFYMTGNRLRIFNEMAIKSLENREVGAMDHDEAVNFLHQALFGEDSLNLARQRVDQMYEDAGMYASNDTKQRAVRDMVLMQLTEGGEFTPEQVQMMVRSSYKIAGLGIGHSGVVNNPISKLINGYKQHFTVEQKKAMANNDWSALARSNAMDTLVNNVIFKFASTTMNWGWIKLEQSGGGLFSGLIYRSKYKAAERRLMALNPTEAHYEAKRDALHNEVIEGQLKAQKAMVRAVQGLALQALTDVSLHVMANNLYQGDDKETAYDKMMAEWSKHRVVTRLMLRLMPAISMGEYLHSRAKVETLEHNHTPAAAGMQAALEEVGSLFDYGDRYSTQVEMANTIHSLSEGGKSAKQAESAAALSLGKYFQIPLVHPANEAYQAIRWMATGKEPMQHYPLDLGESFLKGTSLYETRIFHDNPSVETLPGVSEKATQILNEKGIYKMSDYHNLSDYGRKQVLYQAGLTDKQVDQAVKAYQQNYQEDQPGISW